MSRHENVLTVPVGSIVETDHGGFCWVRTKEGFKRRILELGETDDVSVIVKAGVSEGDEVVLNPLAYLKDAQNQAMLTDDKDEE